MKKLSKKQLTVLEAIRVKTLTVKERKVAMKKTLSKELSKETIQTVCKWAIEPAVTFGIKDNYRGISLEIASHDKLSPLEFDLWIGGELIEERGRGMVRLLEQAVAIIDERLAR